MNMMSGSSDLQNLRSANDDSLTLVMPKNERVTNKETGNINLNLLVTTAQENTIGERQKMADRNDDGEVGHMTGSVQKLACRWGITKYCGQEKSLGKGRRLP